MWTQPGIDVRPLAAFSDNYIWLLTRDRQAVVVDPGDAAPVLAALAQDGLTLAAILVTHHHPDHVGGIAALLAAHPVPVYGPAAEAARIGTISVALAGDEHLDVLGQETRVIAVPGHTLGHIAYHLPASAALFCGDTLFHAGCGRLFEGTPAQMQASLARLADLPDDTAVYCTHEYSVSNLVFARAVESENADIAAALERARAQRAAGLPTLPSRIGLEKKVNPFLRWAVAGIADGAPEPPSGPGPAETFASLRRWKDHFRPPGDA